HPRRGQAMATDPPPYARPRAGTQPPPLYPDYASTVKRAPKRPPIRFEHTLSETTGPVFEGGWAGPDAADLTRQHKGAPLGERMILAGRVPDRGGRPAHIHLAVFGPAFVTRLNTQMYFPGDPLLAYDPIFQSTADAAARERLIAQYDPELSEPEWALGYRWDMVLRGRAATPMDPA